MKYGIWEDESPLSSRGSCFSRKKKNTLSGEKQCSSKRYDKGQRGVLWGDGRELTRQKGLESFEGEVELKLELEGCLAVSSSGREEEGHSNHGAMCKGQDTHPIGEKDEYSVSRSRPESAGSSMHAKGFWFYSGKSRDQACVWEWYLPAVCHQHEDNCWEAGEALLGVAYVREGRAKSEAMSLAGFQTFYLNWFPQLLSKAGRKYHTNFIVE